jgi:hypothetical protein
MMRKEAAHRCSSCHGLLKTNSPNGTKIDTSFLLQIYCLQAKTQNKNTKEIISRVEPAGLRSSAAETKCVGLLAKFLITKGISRS